MDSSTITQTIIDTINTLLSNLFSSVDSSLYSVLDDLTFISPDIINDSNFEKIIGTSSTNGILLIANSLLIGFLLYYGIKLLLSHITFDKIDQPVSFIAKMILFGIFMNCSFFIMNLFLEIFSNITLSILEIGKNLFNTDICFSTLISNIDSLVSTSDSTLDIFSINGLIKATLSMSLLTLVFSYSLRYVLVKVFILLTPFAFISLSISTTSWFFKAWIKNLFSMLFIQIIVALVLVLLFSMDFSDSNILNQFIYVGGIYALIRANSIVRSFIGGISTTVSQSVQNFMNIK